MKNVKRFSVLLAVVCLSTAAYAQDAPKGKGPDGGAPAQRPQGAGRPAMAGALAQRFPLMIVLDTDKDGSISASELENASKSLAKLDKDGDGALSPEELRPDFAGMARDGISREGQPGSNGPPGKEMMARMFAQRDANKDGKLSDEEIPERMQQNLARIDENGDNAIDQQEMEKAMAKMGDRAGKGRGAKGDKDGAGVQPKRPPTE